MVLGGVGDDECHWLFCWHISYTAVGAHRVPLATMMHRHIIIIRQKFTNYGNNSSPLLIRLLVYLTADHNHFSIIYKFIHYSPFLHVVLPERSLRVPQHVRDRRRGSVPDLLNWGEYTEQHKMPEDTVSRIDVVL